MPRGGFLGFLLLCWLASAATLWADTVRVGVLAFRPAPETLSRWQPTIDYLNENSPNHRFTLEALSYDEIDQKAAAGTLDFILTNPSHYILLMHRHGANRVATMLATEAGVSVAGFGGVVLVRRDRADLRTLADLRGGRVAAPSPESLGGYQLQAVLMMENKIVPDRDLQMLFTGMPHDRAIDAVLNGEADGAFVRTGLIEALTHEGRSDLGALRILEPRTLNGFPFGLSTQLVPEWPFAVLPHVDADVAKDVAVALLGVGHESPAAQAGGYVGWTIPGDYEPVRRILERLRMPPYDEAQPIIWRDLFHQYGIALGAIAVLLALAIAVLVPTTIAHRRLKAKNQTIEAIAGSMAEGLYVIDTKGITTFVNPAALHLLGYTHEELIGRVAHDLFHRHGGNDHLPLEKCPIFATVRSGRAYHGIECFERKDGRRFEARVTSSPLSRDGRVVGSVAVFEDVTEEIRVKRQIEYFNEELRKEVEEEVGLRLKSERIYRAIYDNSPEGILIIDAQGVFLRANETAARILKCSAEELIGRSFITISPEIQPETGLFSQVVGFAILSRAMRGHIEQFEWSCLDQNGEAVLLQVLLAPFEGSEEELLVMWRDITEAKKMQDEKELQQAVLIQQSKLAELGSMIGAIAHQWKQPINGVGLIAQGLVDSYDYGELDRQELAQSVESIMRQVEFMARTIDDFRNFYKPGLTKEPFDPYAACVQVISLISPQMAKHNIRVEIGGQRKLEALGYPSEFKQVILNILNNAKDALVSGGIQNPAVTITLGADETNITLALGDNGGGIPAELLPEKIFSPFVSTKGQEGTGIGLSLGRTIIEEKMNGQLQARNSDQGALFEIKLPIYKGNR